MKIHRHLVETVINALEEVFFDQKYADKVIQKNLKSHPKWGSRDRKFFAETIYEVVRWHRLLEFIAGADDAWRIVGVQWLRMGHDLPDWEEFAGLDYDYLKSKEKEAAEHFTILHSIPDWMDEVGRRELGDVDWEKVVPALNKPADVFLRANGLKATPEEVIAALEALEIKSAKVSPDLPHAIKLNERRNIFITEPFRNGLFEIQDAASQMVVPLLGVEPGMRVVDACAGAGGKSLHMASLMKNKGRIISMDVSEWKLQELKVRARRDGVDIIETRLIDSSKVIKRMDQQADRLLLDVPCSGMGVLRRNPDAKWKLDEEEIVRLRALQYEILTGYCNMTKKGGLMVYATCSILPSENEKQVERFMAEHGNEWTLLKQIHTRPDREGYDGFYGAVLKRNS
ncbi:RsmB/NOP family class I SAM-dependent RNA methyltransferase [Bdellovibrio svalbardensis]|uniref:Methyltransferase domain-containing protein n=1 Tax=Bdellovibrio svalbardensis TaxID=2972972 RepID=A0ABT6DPY7_9BACT|nr:methyltransferase domain-containing protein [Bdellovibrio svalbardensis]MDG0817906.1 methyltransferase domain-containing protein [Bdellovibrio svalbardensis]